MNTKLASTESEEDKNDADTTDKQSRSSTDGCTNSKQEVEPSANNVMVVPSIVITGEDDDIEVDEDNQENEKTNETTQLMQAGVVYDNNI